MMAQWAVRTVKMSNTEKSIEELACDLHFGRMLTNADLERVRIACEDAHKTLVQFGTYAEPMRNWLICMRSEVEMYQTARKYSNYTV